MAQKSTKNPKFKLRKHVGCPTAFQTDYSDQARKLCLLGATDKDIADFFEVAKSTVNLWKIQFPEFSEWKGEQAFKIKHVKYDAHGRKVDE